VDLFSQAIVAIDGSKFKVVNNRDKNFTNAKMQRRMAQLEESIERYLVAMDTADRADRDSGAQEGAAAREDRGAETADGATQAA